MNKAYARINWENSPSDATPLNDVNLNKIDAAVDEIDNRVINHEETKATKTEVSTLVQEIKFDESTGVFTITKKNGAVITIDTKMEKIAINFDYDPETERLILTLIDGTKQYIDLSALITQYEFLDSATIGFEVQENGTVKAIVLDGSITENKLQPNYLADIKVEVAKAQASQSAAAQSEANALASENATKKSEANAKTSETNAANSASTAVTKAEEASNSAGAAATSESNASNSANTASSKANEASNSASTAATKANEASASAASASSSAITATAKAGEAADYATEAESWAHGETGTRENENVDNSKYYYEQAKRISQGLQGSLLPMGTITFSQLADQNPLAGYMYNISDNFITDETFKEGAGNSYPAGTNVYWTADGYWDALAGVMVAGVKGSSETEYRQGFVNISKENIGLGNVDNTSDAEKNVKYAASAEKATKDGNGKDIDSTYLKLTGDSENNTVSFTSNDAANPTEWTDASLLVTGEKHSSLFNKISTMFKNIRYLYKMLGTSDISALGGGTVTGAIKEFDENITSEAIPENITSIVALISLVPVGKTKVFFIGNVPSGRLTDFPSVLSGLFATNLVTITIKRTSTWSYIKVNSCVASGVNYTLDGLYNGTNLYWGEGDAALNSNLENMNKIPYFLGRASAIGETISFNLLEYREIVFRVSIGGSAVMYQTIPTPAVQSGYTEITFSEENMFLTILCYIAENGVEFVNIISSWESCIIELIGI